MKKIIPFFLVLMTACNQQGIQYPETKKVDVTDHYFGTEVADTYRWLEDDNSPETKEWVKNQNDVTFNYLEQIPFREKIKERLTNIWNYPKISAPHKTGGKYFISKNDGLQNQSVIYVKDKLDGEEKEILDPNKLSEDGTVALATYTVSKDGKYMAYAISRGGSDWREIFVKEIETGKDLKDHIKWAKFSGISWYNDGFYYSRYNEPKEGDELSGENLNNKLYYHEIGTKQDEDILTYEEPENPERSFHANITEDKKYMVIAVTESTSGNALYYKNLEKKDPELVKLVQTFDNDIHVIDHINGKFYVVTNKNAPKYQLMSIDPENPEKEWTIVIPEKDYVLQGVSIVGGKLFANYMKDAHNKIEVFDLSGNYLYDIESPVMASIDGFQGEKDDTFTFFTVESFTTPETTYKYDIATNTYEVYQKTEVNLDPSEYETKQVFYTSKDGTKIPMFIVHKKDIELNGDNPALLYGYGGFNISYTPYFNVSRLIWLENGGIFAMANLRGGGEYGEEWHKAGTKLNKQNVFDDFIAASEYLINNNYTNSEKLAIQGGSNGGLLVGAVTNQRPELFKVALPAVGVMDMLRYHKFTIGRYWAVDYGTSEDNEEMFRYLYAYSPIHNIKEGISYPATFVTTGDHDDRVVPAHSFKYIATLQKKSNTQNPLLIRIQTNAGHGAGKPTNIQIQELTDMYSFVFYNMGVTPYK